MPGGPIPLISSSSQNSSEGSSAGTSSGRDRPGLIHQIEINRTVFWALLLRLWQMVAGAVSFVMIGVFLSPAEQGYYVTFWSFLALQSLTDLGFTIAVLNFSSHEWSRLQLDENGCITGESVALSRLVSLGRSAFMWFGAAAVGFCVIAGVSGHIVFSSRPDSEVDWQLIWWLCVGCSSLSFWIMPFLSILEGCGQIETVYRFRFMQAIVNNLAAWICFALGLGLWAALAATGMRLVTELCLTLIRYRKFFPPFLRSPQAETVSWRNELGPMQWRIVVSGIFHFIAINLFSPVMFCFHSEQLAGRMGMTRQLLITLQSAAQSWVQARVPEFGRLVANFRFAELDQLFRRTVVISTLVLVVGGLGFLGFLYGLAVFLPRLAERVLGPFSTGVMLLAMIAAQLPWCQTLYLRSHRRDPTIVVNVATSLAVVAGVVLLGWHFADLGAAIGWLLPVLLIAIPAVHRIWRQCRRDWHGDLIESAESST